jgi:hypothetical protein
VPVVQVLLVELGHALFAQHGCPLPPQRTQPLLLVQTRVALPLHASPTAAHRLLLVLQHPLLAHFGVVAQHVPPETPQGGTQIPLVHVPPFDGQVRPF